MNRSQLVSEAARRCGRTRAEVEEVLSAVVDSVVDHVSAGEKVNLSGLARFEPVDKPSRPGRNPATGEQITIAATRAVKIVPAQALKDSAARAFTSS